MRKSWVRQSFEIGLKGILVAAAIYFIISRFGDSGYQGILSYDWKQAWWLVPLFFGLWALNLFLDATIWKTVNHFVGEISLKRALKTNLVCYALAFITPANSGEVAGRYIMLNQNNDRKKTLFLIFWSHFPRLVIKIVLGGSAILLLLAGTGFVKPELAYTAITVGIPVAGLFYFLFIKIQRWLHERNIRKFDFSDYIMNDRPRFSEKLKLLTLAFLKYLTYNAQFLLLILMWGDISLSAGLVFSVIAFYFITAVIPTFAAADFLIKAALAMYIFQFTTADESLLVNAAFVTWLFNIAIPALAGTSIILKANLMTSVRKKLSRENLYGPSR